MIIIITSLLKKEDLVYSRTHSHKLWGQRQNDAIHIIYVASQQ